MNHTQSKGIEAISINDLDSKRITLESIRSNISSIPVLNTFPSVQDLKEGLVFRMSMMIQDNLDRVMKHKSYGQYDLRFRPGLEEIPSDYVADFECSFYNVDRYVLVSVPGSSNTDLLPPETVRGFYSEKKVVNDKRVLVNDTTDASIKRVREEENGKTDDSEDTPPDLVPVAMDEEPTSCEMSYPVRPPHPIPERLLSRNDTGPRFSCLANVCDAEKEYKLHEVVDVVGIVYKGPQDLNLPPLDFTIEVLHMEPAQIPSISHEFSPNTRSELKSALCHILRGDQTAAEYLLLQLVSNRIEGHEALPTMGSWALSISNADDVDIVRFVEFLKSLSRYIPNTIPGVISFETSNSILMDEKFYPLRVADAEHTSPGILQLAPKSIVIIDERTLGEGNVNAMNVLAINKAVREQILIGIFGESSCIDFPIDLKFIILNRGRSRSIFEKINPSVGINGSVPIAHVELRPNDMSEDSHPIVSEDMARYIARCQDSIKDVNISDEIVSQFQNDWVESRKNDPKIPTDDIHIWATLMRVVAASFGQSTVATDHLKDLLDIEHIRRSRCPDQTTPRLDQDIQAVVGG